MSSESKCKYLLKWRSTFSASSMFEIIYNWSNSTGLSGSQSAFIKPVNSFGWLRSSRYAITLILIRFNFDSKTNSLLYGSLIFYGRLLRSDISLSFVHCFVHRWHSCVFYRNGNSKTREKYFRRPWPLNIDFKEMTEEWPSNEGGLLIWDGLLSWEGV